MKLIARLVVGAALLIAAAAAFWGGGVEEKLSNGGFQDPKSESMRVDQILARDFGTGPANLVLIVDGGAGVDDPATSGAAAALARRVESFPGVVSVDSYWTSGRLPTLRSRDARLGLILVRLGGDEDAYRVTAERLTPLLNSDALDIRVSGMAQVSLEVERTIAADLTRAELLVAPITLILLVLIFRSAVAALLPLLVGAVSVISTTAVLRLLTEFTEVSVFALNVTTALGLGLAIDYSLFMVARFRDELAAGSQVRAAVFTTVRTAGRTVVFSAVTVALSLSALLVFPLGFFRSIAYGGVAVVLIAALTSVVVLPALFALLGHRVNSLNLLRRLPQARAGLWRRLALAVMRRPIPVATAVIALLVVLGSPFLSASFSLTDDRVLPGGSPVHQASQVVREQFDAREASAIPIVMPGLSGPDVPASLNWYASRLSELPDVDRVDTLIGSYAEGRAVAPPVEQSRRFASAAGGWVSVVPSVEPYSPRGSDLVARLRSSAAPASIYVGGQAAFLVDTRNAIGERLPLALGLIAVTTFVLLFLFTGSVLIPIKAVVLNLLSLTATFGAMVYVFQDGNLRWLVGDFTVTGMIDATMPVLMFCVAFGLSMDYEVFLLSRIREEYLRTGDNVRAVAQGLEKTGSIVTAAAVLIAAVLLAFASSGITLLKLLGLGLALAVIVDATLVRGLLVPAFMRLAGRANWWAPPTWRRLHARIGLR